MGDAIRCPQCHYPLPAHAPEGLCPECLLKVAVEGVHGSDSGHGVGKGSTSTLAPEELGKDDRT